MNTFFMILEEMYERAPADEFLLLKWVRVRILGVFMSQDAKPWVRICLHVLDCSFLILPSLAITMYCLRSRQWRRKEMCKARPAHLHLLLPALYLSQLPVAYNFFQPCPSILWTTFFVVFVVVCFLFSLLLLILLHGGTRACYMVPPRIV